jgi:hypothetical protein
VIIRQSGEQVIRVQQPPRDPALVFETISGLITAGAVEMAREVFLADVNERVRWTRMTTAVAVFEQASKGAKRNANGNKVKGSTLTPTQKRRVERYDELLPQHHSERLALMVLAKEEGCTTEAIRQSLRSAGRRVSTRSKSD